MQLLANTLTLALAVTIGQAIAVPTENGKGIHVIH